MSDTNQNNDNLVASDFVTQKFMSYGQHCIYTKFPSVIDGLKAIGRRILWVSRNLQHPTKVLILAGELSKLHISGNLSMGKAIKRMCQPFSNVTPLMYSISNVGGYGTDESGAPRYLEVRMSEFGKDVYFNDVNSKTLKYIPAETGYGYEPQYYIPKLPMALIVGGMGIGVAFKTTLPSLEFNNLCDLTIDYINTNHNSNNYYKYLVPEFPNHLLLRNHKQLLTDYKKGKYDTKIITDGLLELSPNAIVVKSIGYGTSFINASYYKFKNTLKDKNNKLASSIHTINRYSSGEELGEVKIVLKRNVNPFSILQDLKQFITFTSNFYPKTLYVNKNQKMAEYTPRQVLDVWYAERKKSVLADLRYVQSKLIERARQLQAYIVGVEHADYIFNEVFRKVDKLEDTYEILFNKYRLSIYQIQFLSKLRYVDVMKQSIDNLKKSLEENKQKFKELQNKFLKVDQLIIDDIVKLKNKYKNAYPRKTKLPNFIGYVKLPSLKGIIQFTNVKELKSILHIFSKENYKVELYPKYCNKYLIVNNEIITEDECCLPKQFSYNKYVVTSGKPNHTICLKNGMIFRLSGIILTDIKTTTAYVDDDFVTVTKKGVVKRYNFKDITLRKTINVVGVGSDIKHITNITATKVVVAYMNIKEPNYIRFMLLNLSNDSTNLIKPATTNFEILKIFEPTENVIINTIPKYLSRCSVKTLYLKDVLSLLNDNQFVKVNVNSRLPKQLQLVTNVKFKTL